MLHKAWDKYIKQAGQAEKSQEMGTFLVNQVKGCTAFGVLQMFDTLNAQLPWLANKPCK